MAEAISQALGPIFHAQPDYKTITEAIALTVARVAQATQDRGFEHQQLGAITAMASNALTEFLNEEEAYEARQKIISKGLDGFAEMARSDEGYGPAYPLAALHGDLGVEARDAAEEFAGRFHDEKGRLTEAGFEQLKKDVIALHTPDPEVVDAYNPDGPRAYL